MVGWKNDKSSKADDYQLIIESLTPLIIILAALGAGFAAWWKGGDDSENLIRFCELLTSGAIGMIVPRGLRYRPPPAALPQQRPPAPRQRPVTPAPARPLDLPPFIDNPDRPARLP